MDRKSSKQYQVREYFFMFEDERVLVQDNAKLIEDERCDAQK